MGGGLKKGMARRVAGMMGLPDVSAMMGGDGGGDNGADAGAQPASPNAPRRKFKKKPRHKKKR